uniref:Uncharacterized protein n=1 Tax=Sparus aurata TaxID=8175 RepID=A0A671UYP7_SPAAU
MSQRKMLQFSTGPLLLLLPWFYGLVLGEVSNDFSQCLDFFYEKTPPQGFKRAEYQPICQRYKDEPRFATLYQPRHRTPLYSAYKLSFGKGQTGPISSSVFVSKLASPKAGPDMQPFPCTIPKRVKNSQAVPEDYKNSGYTRGHLNPSMHHKIKADREATFTLTNIVPQQQSSNQHTWNHLEREVFHRFKAHCNRLMYVITGVMPYESEAHWIKKRVSVPEYMWSAYCCPSYRRSLPESVRMFFPTYAAVGRNDRVSGEEIVPVNPDAKDRIRGYDVRRMPLQELEHILRRRLSMPRLRLFKRQCQ